ncbi:hypothetical protein BDR07DRAFT_1461968 [Suillus spraguei]|nr:hypothetical protein BDR07DRAFT_1461968 [Suillus spraguei]
MISITLVWHMTPGGGASLDFFRQHPCRMGNFHSTSIMASEVVDDSKSVTVFNAPPPYSTTSTFAPTDASTVLTCIFDIVSAPDFTPCSVVPIIDACSTALPAAEFSDLLQTLNIEGHTALYWAIVNDRREVFAALSKFTPKLSSICSSDLRLACMITNDQPLFTQLNLGITNSEDGPLRRSLGCPSDEVQVDSGDGLGKNQFVAHFRIKKFQKRIRITYDVNIEFVARGRIWSLLFFMMSDGKWQVGFSISQPSLPAHPACVIMIEAHKKPGCEVPPEGLKFGGNVPHMLVAEPDGRDKKYDGKPFFSNIIGDDRLANGRVERPDAAAKMKITDPLIRSRQNLRKVNNIVLWANRACFTTETNQFASTSTIKLPGELHHRRLAWNNYNMSVIQIRQNYETLITNEKNG